MSAPYESQPWWAMKPVDPGEFALLGVDEAVDVLWNLCSAHGMLAPIVAGLEAKREAHAAATIDAITNDISEASRG